MVNSKKRRENGRRTYVLDTSVLLADPGSMSRFEEHEVVLPVVVVTELEAKRHHPELGYFARQALSPAALHQTSFVLKPGRQRTDVARYAESRRDLFLKQV